MKILYLLKRDPDETLRRIIAVHEREHEVHVEDLRVSRDYPGLVRQIARSDKVISW